jgi:hypothetical protein
MRDCEASAEGESCGYVGYLCAWHHPWVRYACVAGGVYVFYALATGIRAGGVFYALVMGLRAGGVFYA